MSTDKLWDGRFAEQTHAKVERFSASVQFDQRLASQDIAGSIAHARMLARVGVLTAAESDMLVGGLNRIRAEIERGDFEWSAALEDVHMNIEARLTDMLGETGKKLHTARSRNDQVATDLRLYTREAIDRICDNLLALQEVLLGLAEREADSVMPGFTHLQPAQPVTLGHHLLAWFEMLQRDRARLVDCRVRVNVCPLGCAALAGTSFPIDRSSTAAELGFEGICENSLDAVSDRDFVVEVSAHAALLMVHLSRIAEELVLWASAQYGFVDLGDAFCTGSSIMPQKKNPDVAELIRGKTGRVAGHVTALLMLLKAQPLAYNRDNQEDKEALFDTVDTVTACLDVLCAMLPQVKFEREVMRRSAARGHPTATDLADYLVRKSMPFREAHAVVGRAVRYATDHRKDLAELSLEELRAFSDCIDDDVYDVLTLEGSVNARSHIGGTAPAQVRAAVARGRARCRPGGA